MQGSSLNKRAFLVGCGRSGTTLLASLIAAHPQIKGFPETAYFLHAAGQLTLRCEGKEGQSLAEKLATPVTSLRIKLGLGHFAGSENIKDLLEKINRQDLVDSYPIHSILLRKQINGFLEVLDTLTQEDGKDFWIEKTPKHLGYIDIIERYIQPVKFIHLLRNGADVIASLTSASRKYPIWKNYTSLDFCIQHWNHSIQMTMNQRHKPNHFVVTYEQLIENPPVVLREICRFLEVDFVDTMISEYQTVAKDITLDEPWKANNTHGLYNANSSKFYELFDLSQQKYIEEHLIKMDLEALSSINLPPTADMPKDSVVI